MALAVHQATHSGAQMQKGLTLLKEVKNCCTEEMTFQQPLRMSRGLCEENGEKGTEE